MDTLFLLNEISKFILIFTRHDDHIVITHKAMSLEIEM